jgi:hypothetical protein
VQGPLYDVDLLCAITLPQGKFGARIAYLTGHQDYYSWREDSSNATGDDVVDANFIGSYEKGNWSGTTRNFKASLYGNLQLQKSQRYSLNSFVSLGYEKSLQGQALSRNLEISNNAKDKMTSVSIEAAPNIQIPFDGWFSYIDFAIVAAYGYSRFDNTDMRWIGGGQLETWVNSRTSAGDETTWEGYSYANRNTVDFGIDLNSMFPVLTSDIQQIGLGLQLLIDSRFMFMTKYYGSNAEQGATADFRVDMLRKDFEREIRFATGVKAQYQRRPFLAWLEITEPLLRSFMPRTRVTDARGKETLFEHEKSPLWMSQEGLRVGIFAAYEWTLPWLSGM